MTTIDISTLTQKSTLDGTEMIPVSDTEKVSAQQIADLASSAAGTAATITIGTVTTGDAGTNASVTNSGTEQNAVLDFVIPRGADGSSSGTGDSVYDIIIRTQAEFESMIELSNWGGVTSVAIIGVITLSNRPITIPENVVLIDGCNVGELGLSYEFADNAGELVDDSSFCYPSSGMHCLLYAEHVLTLTNLHISTKKDYEGGDGLASDYWYHLYLPESIYINCSIYGTSNRGENKIIWSPLRMFDCFISGARFGSLNSPYFFLVSGSTDSVASRQIRNCYFEVSSDTDATAIRNIGAINFCSFKNFMTVIDNASTTQVTATFLSLLNCSTTAGAGANIVTDNISSLTS